MALTKEEIKAKLLPRQLSKRAKAIVWGDVVSSIASANQTKKDLIIAKLNAKDFYTVGKYLTELLIDNLIVEVGQNIDQALANNSLNLDELSDILQ